MVEFTKEFARDSEAGWVHCQHYADDLLTEHAFKPPGLNPDYSDLCRHFEAAGLDATELVSYEVKVEEKVPLRTNDALQEYRRARRQTPMARRARCPTRPPLSAGKPL